MNSLCFSNAREIKRAWDNSGQIKLENLPESLKEEMWSIFRSNEFTNIAKVIGSFINNEDELINIFSRINNVAKQLKQFPGIENVFVTDTDHIVNHVEENAQKAIDFINSDGLWGLSFITTITSFEMIMDEMGKQ